MSNILYTGGTFDLFHFGHIEFLKKCHQICNHVVVGLNTDDFVSRYKGQTILSYKEREISLLSCPYVTRVVPNTFGEDSKPTILQVKPSIIAVGDDWMHKDYYQQMTFTQQWLDINDIILIYISCERKISTSEIKKRLLI